MLEKEHVSIDIFVYNEVLNFFFITHSFMDPQKLRFTWNPCDHLKESLLAAVYMENLSELVNMSEIKKPAARISRYGS